MGDTLSSLRGQIDSVDSDILDLLEERFELTKQVGIYKLQSKDSVIQNGRWQEVLASLMSQAEQKGLSPEMVEAIWNEVHKHSIQQQVKIQENA